MSNKIFDIDAMRDCLTECFGVEDDYITPVAVVANDDPKIFARALAYFTGDRYSSFDDPAINHCEDCAIPYELLPDKLKIEIEIGGSAMMTGEDLALALDGIANKIKWGGLTENLGRIQDRSGNTVGTWELK